MNDYIKDFWENYGYIYNSTKEMYILAEEYDDELSSFIQPIKEQKDSLEHIVRAFVKYSSGEAAQEDYIKQNLSKAQGHIFRAFYDTADILSIILREKISANLKNFSYKDILAVWSNYEKYRIILVDMPKRFANLREKKDIAKTSAEIIDMVQDYKNSIKELFIIYDEFFKVVYPKLNKL